jgi:predicted solute-binding protein
MGLQNVEQIVERHAVPRGWPAGLARQYLTKNLIYDVGPQQLEAVRRFHDLAARYGIIAQPARELETL